MPQTSHPNPLGPLNPVSDQDAARLATPEAHARLVAELMADLDQGASRHGGRSDRPAWGVVRGWRRPTLVASVITAAAAIVLLLPGLLAGSGSATEPAVAQAQLLAHISAALSPRRATIVVEVQRVRLFAGGFTQRAQTYKLENITETAAGGRLDRTFVRGSYMWPGYQNVWTSSWEAIYDPANNTIYSGALNNGGPAFVSGDTSVFKQQLDEHLYRLGGTSTIEGRAALKLVPVRNTVKISGVPSEAYPTVYVSPKTYYPIRSVSLAPPGSRARIGEVVNWLAYKVLPATTTNKRLVSLSARHPDAQVVDSAAAMRRVYSHERTS